MAAISRREDHVPLHQGLQRLQSGGAVLGAALVKAAAVLVELGDKIEMTYDVYSFEYPYLSTTASTSSPCLHSGQSWGA